MRISRLGHHEREPRCGCAAASEQSGSIDALLVLAEKRPHRVACAIGYRPHSAPAPTILYVGSPPNETIEKQGGSAGPQWLNSHPNPGDRYAYITREATLLEVQHPVGDTRSFTRAQARLRQLTPAPTTEEATRKPAGVTD